MPRPSLIVSVPSVPRSVVPPFEVHRKAWKFGDETPSPGRSENPVTSPLSLMSIGVFQYCPPSVGRLVAVLLYQSTMCFALAPPTALAQSPEMPTILPLLLIAVAAPSASLP